MPQPSFQLAEPTRPGPVLVAARTRYSALAMWHLLSLDAPTVAAVWTWFIAHWAGIALPWTGPAAMFIAVWMIYAADRLFDARLLDTHPMNLQIYRNDLEERHRFHHRHRSRFLIAILLAAAALVFLLPRIAHRALELYALLATLLAAWMLVIHASPAASARRLPKELAVGIFFPAAVFIPTVAQAPSLQPEFLPVAGLFACVCTLNCLFLYAWEHPTERDRAQAHWTTLTALQHLRQLSSATMLLAVAVAIFVASKTPFTLSPAIACGVSAAMLLLLHTLRSRVAPLRLRALADLVLLTPLLAPPAAWLLR